MFNMQYLQMYRQTMGTGHPGCFIILIDQSGSMLDSFGQGQMGAGLRKCDQVATVVNRVLAELVARSTKNNAVNDRVHLAVLGYRNNAVYDAIPTISGLVSIQQLAANPVRVEQRMRKEYDSETGQMIDIPTPFQVWIDPVGDGGTPMTAALNRAYELAWQWAQQYQHCYPPLILNITDGMATDGDPRPAAANLCSITTQDGAAMLFNCHITDTSQPEVRYPADSTELAIVAHQNEYALPLFEASSLIPDTMRTNALNNLGMNLAPYARGFIFNGDMDAVIQMLTFVTVASNMNNR
jgi:hypothetical protein